MFYPFEKMGGTASNDAVARRPQDAEKIILLVFFLLITTLYSGSVKAFELYKTFQTPDVFLAEMFNNNVPTPVVLNLDANAQSEISAVFNRPFPSQRVRYWKDASKTVWVFDDIGKEGYVPTTSGFAVSNGEIETARVLIYRESRGEQVAEPSFLNQLKGAKAAGSGLSNKVDNITGATLSVVMMERMARTAITLDSLSRK
ncbi:MAG: FMN-binding protein [Zhongshania sp.]|uniref:FMN-binding protein n=1 Tax=Zhongshania sp. TaxID=1971902 RepID=UPI0026073F6A|nr:FMN-binding protein [Zhongshania sp.]MDF1692422.1 FMN-binding protein [Zhongshania sp.]